MEYQNLIATSPRMQVVLDLIASCSACNAHVLITGESGAGKETVARAIHAASRARRSGPFGTMNCGAVVSTLLESELFGHVKGVFVRPEPEIRPGLFEKLQGGTLYLAGIEDIPLSLQQSLVQAIKDQRITRVGDSASVEVDVRIIASTCSDLDEFVRAGKFRADLFERLSVIRIDLPPLRERREDILPLAERFAADYAGLRGRTIISQEAQQALVHYRWPGNVRELQNAIMLGCHATRDSVIRPEHLPIAQA